MDWVLAELLADAWVAVLVDSARQEVKSSRVAAVARIILTLEN